jgi:peptidoglycan lytic transglycosylase
VIFRCQVWTTLVLLAAGLGGSLGVRPAQATVSEELRVLAAQSNTGWSRARLRRYAASVRDSEQKGLAYFLVGYRELQGKDYGAALRDLTRAADTGFSLADYAACYAAAAAEPAGHPQAVQELLKDFPARFPHSPLRHQALERYAQALVDSGQAAQALQALLADPHTRQQPALALLLGKAYTQTGQQENAAQAFQEVYYSYPAAAESREAGKALDQLHAQMGAKFPEASLEIQTARADKLRRMGRARDALSAYQSLLEAHASSPLDARWTVGRARCLLRLRRIGPALDALEKSLKDPAADAQRMELLVETYVRQDDAQSFQLVLDQMGRLDAHSPAYAGALDAVGDYYVRQGQWPRAADYYRPLARLFPHTEWGEEASWRVAWATYLQRQRVPARVALANFLAQYPASPHVPAALYWLGRLAQDDGALPEARQLYQSLDERFGQSYYAVRAEELLKRLNPRPEASAAGHSPLWPAVVSLTRQIPPLDPSPIDPCAPPQPSPQVLRAHTLHALGLDSLAGELLEDLLAQGRADPDVLLELGRLARRQGDYAAAMFDAVKLVGNYWQFDFSGLPKEVWDLLYPRAYWDLVKRESSARGLDPYLVMGLIRQESAFNPRAISVANARGLMQVMPSTATRRRRSRRYVARRLLSPSYNVRVGTLVLRNLQTNFDGNGEEMLAAYHAGQTRVNSWLSGGSFRDPAEFLESIPIPATRIYVERVLRDATIYRQFLTGAAPYVDCRPMRRPSSALPPAARCESEARGARSAFRQAGQGNLALLGRARPAPGEGF